MKLSAFNFFTTIFLLAGGASAVNFYGNQSDLKWKNAETEHFRFIYPAEYTGQASKVSGYAEAVYDTIVNRYGMKMPGKINASLSNALYSNGSAVPSENSINLWLTNWDFKIRSSHGWLSDVVTHEFSHLVSIESGSKLPPSLYGLQISYTDYYNERTTSDFLTTIPFTLQPLWLAEGTAQYESSRMGFDSWDTHRDMLLRVAALNDDLLPLSYMHEFSSNSLHAELGPYTQGFAITRYIAKHYGDKAIPKIWKELGKPYRATLSGALEKVLGIDEQKLYDEWKKEIVEEYKNQKDSLGSLVSGEKITAGAFWQDFPVFAGSSIYGVSNFGGEWFDGGLFKIETEDKKLKKDAPADSSSGDVEIGEIEIEGADSTINIVDFAVKNFKLKKPWLDKGIDVYEDSLRGPILAYVSYKNRDKDGHAHFDIALSDTSKNLLSATYLVDAVYPAIDKQGTTIAFARREPFSTRFVLSTVPLPKDFSDYTTEEPKDIFIPDSSFGYYNIYSPKFSPNGNRIAFGFFDDTHRGIAIIDSDGKNFKIVSNKNFDERDVNWLSDQKIVFASNRNGIFNLVEKNLETGKERILTNVVGGAFTPVLANDTLFFTQYDADGFSLYKLAYVEKQEQTQELQSSLICDKNLLDITLCKLPHVKPDSVAANRSEITLYGTLPKQEKAPLEIDSREFAGVERDYKPIPTIPLFVPILSFNENAPDLTVFGEGETKVKGGLALLLSDPLKKNSIQIGLLLELGNGFDFINADGLNPKQEKEFFASWQNRSTPLDLGIAYSYTNFTSKDTVRYEDPRAHQDSVGTSHYAISMQSIVGSAGYSLFKSIDTLQAALSYDWSDFNLYEDNFDWTYQKRVSALLALGLYADHESEASINGQGNGLLLYYQYANSDLYRPGTFAESFTITSNGVAEPNYRNFNIHTLGLNLYGSLQSPFTGARIAAGGKLSGIVKWNTDAKEDSLDSYYYTPVFLAGYPYLRSSESYTLAGTKTAVAEIHYLFPIYEDLRKSAWIFSTRDLYIDIFAQAGAAWTSKWFDVDKITKSDFWDRSLGVSFRMSNKLFYSIPLDMTLTFARGLDRIGEDNDLRGGKKLNPIDIAVLPKAISPTRINFTLGMGFNNTWQ